MVAATGFNLSSTFFIVRQSPHPEKAAVYVGVNIFVAQLVAATLLIIGGAVIDRFSYTPIFITVSATGGLAVLTYLWAGVNGARA